MTSSGLTDLLLPVVAAKSKGTPTLKQKFKGKGRQMDSSYEVVRASDKDSEATLSGEEMEEDVNGEEVRQRMEGFQLGQVIRTAVAGVGFMMSVVGIWGDGAADTVIIEI